MSRSLSPRPLFFIVALLAVAALVFAMACGGDSKDKASNGTPGPAQTDEESGGNGGDGPAPAGISREDLPEPGPTDATVAADAVTAATGADIDANVTLTDFPDPGLGAWTVDITYDASVVSITNCNADTAGGTNVCNDAFADDTVRIAGAVAEGLTGDIVLGTLTFRCETAGTSPLTLSLDVLADGTLGAPTERPANVVDGSVTCS
ncbi:MAG: cohesin domain-containing protein [Dehalococcoidia bacterium]